MDGVGTNMAWYRQRREHQRECTYSDYLSAAGFIFQIRFETGGKVGRVGLDFRDADVDVVRRFLDSQLTGWEWDNFIGVAQKNPKMEELRSICLQARRNYPAGAAGEWCSREGMEVIRKAIESITRAQQ